MMSLGLVYEGGRLLCVAVALSLRPLLAGILLLFLWCGGVERVERGVRLGAGGRGLGRGGRVRVGCVPRAGRVLGGSTGAGPWTIPRPLPSGPRRPAVAARPWTGTRPPTRCGA